VKKDIGKSAHIRPSKTVYEVKSGERLKPRFPSPTNSPLSSELEHDIEHYFPYTEPTVTTYLFVPLAPSSRAPLPAHPPATPPDEHSHVPVADIAQIHVAHHVHSLRVSSLFHRLDQAAVWDRGVRVETFGYSGAPGGRAAARYIRVVFSGWTEEGVSAVIGTAGQQWCQIQQVQHEESRPGTPLSSLEARSTPSPPASEMMLPSVLELSLAMPSLDFSASFHTSHFHSPTLRNSSESRSSSPPYGEDSEDELSDSDNEWSQVGFDSFDPFSSHFAERIGL